MNSYDMSRNDRNPLLAPGAFAQVHSLVPGLCPNRPFVAATRQVSFRIAVSCDVEFALLPLLLRRVLVEAPDIDLTILRADAQQIPALLQAGEVSLGIGATAERASGEHRALLRPMNTCVLRADSMPDAVTLNELCRRPHVQVSSAAPVHEALDHALSRLGRQRRTVLRVSQLSALPALLAQTDLLALVPDYVAQALVMHGGLRCDPLPVHTQALELAMSWNASAEHDSSERWLRSRCRMFLAA
jgi:LysR family transcriptional activator of mexEF-oprN operon